jgi:hypothetical protein
MSDHRLITCGKCGSQSYPGVRYATHFREDWGWIQQQLWLFDFGQWDEILMSYRNRFLRAQRTAIRQGVGETFAASFGRREANAWLLESRPKSDLPVQTPAMLPNFVTDPSRYEIVGKGALP